MSESSSSRTSLRNRRSQAAEKMSGKWLFFVGDFEPLTEYLSDKSNKSFWIIFKFLDAFFRSYSQIVFTNNPISGILILLGIAISDLTALLASMITCTLAIIISVLLRQDCSAIAAGLFGYNAILHSTVSIGLLPSLYPELDTTLPKFWLLLLLSSVFSVIITSSFTYFCKHLSHHPLPCFTLPFNFVQYILIFCFLNNALPQNILSEDLLKPPTINLTLTRKLLEFQNVSAVAEVESLNWGNIFSGTITSMTQVFGLISVPGSLVMYLALFICSPICASFCYLGAFLGTILGILFANNADEIYNGVWGYNALLCANVIGGFGFVLNLQSAILSLCSIMFVVVFQHFLTYFFSMVNLPVLSMPFNITAILFLGVTSAGLHRPETFRYHEHHRRSWKKKKTIIEEEFRKRNKSGVLKTDV